MSEVMFEILKDYGSLSLSGDVYFRYINWNGHKKYDLRRWREYGDEPAKGLTLTEEEIEKLYSLLVDGLSALSISRPRMPLSSVKVGKATAKFLINLGSFGESGNLTKQLNYIDWGHGAKFDVRPWNEDLSICGKGVTLTEGECEKLKEIFEDEFGFGGQYGISFEDFVVRSNIFSCNKNHELESIQALISVLKYNGEVSNEIVSAGFCKHCNCYFILERDYLRLRSLGLPLCRQITEKAYRENGDELFNGEGLNPQSILNQIGYNVNANEDLSNTQRQDILSFAVETGLYTPSGICSFLDWLIDKNSRVSNRDMSDAIRKWTEDRNYIARYKIGTRPMKGVKSLKGRSVR